MSTARLAIRGVAFNWVGRACSIGIAFVVTPVVIHGLGTEAFGIWAMVMSLSAFYALSNLGFRAAGVKYISQFAAVDDCDSVNKVIVTMLVAYLPLAASVFIVAVCVAYAIPHVIATELVSESTLRGVVIVTGAAMSVGLVGQVFEATLVAFKRFDRLNAVAVVAQISQGVLIITAISSGFQLLAMAWIILFVTTLRQLYTFLLAIRTANYLSFSVRFFQWSTARMLFQFGSLNIVVSTARKLARHGGPMIIGIMLGPVMVAYYAVAAAIAFKSEDIARGVNSVLMPLVSQLDAQNRREDLAEAFFLASRILLAVAIGIAVTSVSLGRPLIGTWIGPEFVALSYPVLCLLTLAGAIWMPSMSAANVLKGIGRIDRLAKLAVVRAALTLTLSFVLVSLMEILGLGYAVLASEIVISVLLVAVTCRTIQVTLRRYAWKVIIPGTIAGLPGVAVAGFIWAFATPTHIVHVILLAMAILIVTGVSMLFICFDGQLRTRILRALVGREHPGNVRFPVSS